MAINQSLQGGRDEKIFLTQAKFAACRTLVIGIEELADRLSACLLGAGAQIVAGVENVELERVGRARRPQPQRVDVLAAPTHDRGVVGDRLNGLARMPCGAVASIGFDMFDRATEIDAVDDPLTLELP